MPKTDSSRGLSGVLLANGTVPLTANWNMGAFTATFTKTGATAATQYDGFVASNTTTASLGNQMYGGYFHSIGNGWATTSSTSRTTDFRWGTVPVQGAANPTALWTLESSINGGAFSNPLTFSSAGQLIVPSLFVNVGTLNCGAIAGGGATFSTIGASSTISMGSTGAATVVTGLNLNDLVASTSGVPQQYSPAALWAGTAWTGAASQVANFRAYVKPINGTTPITAQWILQSQINAGGYSDRFVITDTGNVTISTGNLTLGTAGNALFITEGSNGRVGQTALVAGTKAITITGLTTSSRAFVTLVTPTGVTLTTTYQGVCTANTLTIQANVAAGTINVADTSTLNYFVIN